MKKTIFKLVPPTIQFPKLNKNTVPVLGTWSLQVPQIIILEAIGNIDNIEVRRQSLETDKLAFENYLYDCWQGT